MMKALVTGGAGYIGSILTPQLLNNGFAVTVVDSLMFENPSLLAVCSSPNFHFIRGDVRDRQLMEREISKHDILIPLAALVGAPLCSRDPDMTKAINFGAIKHLCSVVSKEQMLVFPVTNSGYGIGEEGAYCDENSPLKPISLYGRTKVDAEKLLLDSGQAVTLRLATVFGAAPRMRMDLLVNDFVYRAYSDRFLVLFESHFKRNYIHIRDVAEAFLFGINKFSEMKGEPFNVGLSDANLSKMELCQEIKKQIPDFHIFESEIAEDPDKRNYIVSNDKLEKLGYRPRYSLQDGIRELIGAYSMMKVNNFGNI